MSSHDLFVEIILKGRTHRDVDYDDTLLRALYNEFCETYLADKPYFIVCNSLQNRSCFTVANRKSFIIFDYYNIDIMNYLNSIPAALYKDAMKPLFYKVLSEYLYVSGFSHASYVSILKFVDSIPITPMKVKENAAMLEVQQVFILYHELYHYFYYNNSDIISAEKENTLVELSNMINHIESETKRIKPKVEPSDRIKYYEELGMHNYVIESLHNDGVSTPEQEFGAMRDCLKQNSILEECVCDKYASIKAFMWGITNRNLQPEICMSYVCAALNNQFLMSFIFDFF